MKSALQAEQLGNECCEELLNHLLKCKNQSEACPVIHSFLLALCNERRHKHKSAICSGVTTALVDVLLTGLKAIKVESAQ
jgi:hypothetical protein